ncbi:MAG: PilZ domain-containing protein, partial [Bdellovibrionota bacterium]
MSIFNLFFKKPPVKSSEPSSSDLTAATGRVSTRVAVRPLHNIYLVLGEDKTQIELINISVTGIGALHTQRAPWPSPGQDIRASLHINSDVFDIQLKIVHFTNGLVGCLFVKPDPSFQKAIKKYFTVELSAIAMTQVHAEVMQEAEDGKPHWFLGENNCELYFIENADHKITRFHLSFFGNFFENDGHTLRYGQITSSSREFKPGMKGSDLVR